MRAWEWFEVNVLDDLGIGSTFTNRNVASWYGITPDEASSYITAYVDAQRRPRNPGRYVLHREGRTAAAWWTIGMRTDDARDVLGQWGDDIRHRARYAVEPDLRRIAARNPRAARFISSTLEPAVNGLVSMVEAMMATVHWQPDDDDDD